MRPTQGPHNMGIGTNQRPRSKTNKLYYYQGYHDGSSKYKKKPPKGMYINHDDVVKLAEHDLKAKDSPRKQPVSRNNDLLVECDHEISVLYSQVRVHIATLWRHNFTNKLFFFFLYFHVRFHPSNQLFSFCFDCESKDSEE